MGEAPSVEIKTNEIPNCTVTIVYRVQSYDHYNELSNFRNHSDSGRGDRIDVLINSLRDPSIVIKQFMSWKYEPEKVITYNAFSMEQDDQTNMIKLNNGLDKSYSLKEILMPEGKLCGSVGKDSKFYKIEEYEEKKNNVFRDREFIPTRVIVHRNKFGRA